MKKYKPKRFQTKRFELNKRESSNERGYDHKWRKYRFRFLHYNPKCYVCAQKSNVVDHYVPWKLDKEKYFWNETNYIPLCSTCHNKITAMFDRYKDPLVKEKSEWIKKERERNNVTVKVKIVSIKD